MKTTKALWASALVLMLLAGCAGPFGDGRLELVIGGIGAGSRTIAPAGLEESVSRYDIVLTAVGGGLVELSVTENEAVISGLSADFWTITVSARDAAGDLLASGSSNIQIFPNVTSRTHVDLSFCAPVPGAAPGELSLTVRIPATITFNQSAVVPSWDETPGAALTFVLDGAEMYNEASYSASSLPPGSHSFALELSNAGDVFASLLESVIVVADSTTEAVLLYLPEDQEFTVGHAPAAPADVTLHKVDYGYVLGPRHAPVISWTPVPGVYSGARANFGRSAAGYLIWNCADPEAPGSYGEAIAIDPYESYYEETLDWATDQPAMYWMVCAFNPFGESEAVVVGPQPPVPSNPEYISLGTNPDSFDISWSEHGSATSYKLYMRDAYGEIICIYPAIPPETITMPVSFEALVPGGTYEFTVSALIDEEESDYMSNIWVQGIAGSGQPN